MKTLTAYKLIKIASDRNQPSLNRENLITLKIASRVIDKKITFLQFTKIYDKINKSKPRKIHSIIATKKNINL